jgi:hypothetical protein
MKLRVKYSWRVKVDMVCPKCRQQVRDNARYCHRCGARLPLQPHERAVNDIYLVAKAAGITILLNFFLVSFLAAVGDPFLLFFGQILGPFIGGILFGLAFLLFLEFLGNRFHPFNKDWTLIMAWKRAWESRRYLLGIFLSFALGWWWFSIIGFLIFGFTWGFAFILLGALILAPIFGLVNWVLGWVYAFLTAILNRFFVFIPYIPSEEDRQRAEQFLKNAYNSLQQRIKQR